MNNLVKVHRIRVEALSKQEWAEKAYKAEEALASIKKALEDLLKNV